MQRCDKCGCLDLTHCGCGACDEIDVEIAAIGEPLGIPTMTVWKHDVFEAVNTIANIIESDLVELDEAITDVACELSNAGIEGSHSVNRLKAIYRGMRNRIISVGLNLRGKQDG